MKIKINKGIRVIIKLYQRSNLKNRIAKKLIFGVRHLLFIGYLNSWHKANLDINKQPLLCILKWIFLKIYSFRVDFLKIHKKD